MAKQRCEFTKANGEQCKRWAVLGDIYCSSHGGQRETRKQAHNTMVTFRRGHNGGLEVKNGEIGWGAFVQMNPYAIRNGKIYDPDAGDCVPLIKALKGAALAIYLYLAAHVDKDGWAWPGRASIEAGTGYSKVTVTRATARLESLGLIKIEMDKEEGTGYAHNVYCVDRAVFRYCKKTGRAT